MINGKERIIKKALVTGGAGFIGSHICERLADMGVNVVSLDDYSAGRDENLRGINCEKVSGDILNEALVMDLMRGVDVVFHNAASKKSVCLADPRRDLDVNAKGTLTLLTAALNQGVKKFVHASTGSVYGYPICFPQTEEHPLRPTSYYGVSKLAGERYAQMYYMLYGLDTTVLRYFHVYGPRQSGRPNVGGVVAIFISSILAGSLVYIHGDGSQERSFTYIDDVVNANMMAVESRASTGKVYNCASGLHVTVLDLYKKLVGLLDYDGPPPLHVESDPGEVFRFDVSNERARKELGLNFTTIDEGLKKTISWFRFPSKGGCS